MPLTKVQSEMMNSPATEGTFTPTVVGTSAAGSGASYTSQRGNYIRIGNTVFFHIYVNYSGLSGATGNLRITGLPFTAANTSSMKWGCNVQFKSGLTGPTSSIPHALVEANTAQVDLYSIVVGSGNSTALAVDDAAEFTVSGFYQV